MEKSNITLGTILPRILEPIRLRLAIDPKNCSNMNDALMCMGPIMVHRIIEDELWLERPEYQGFCHWVTTFKELERIGIIKTSNIETYAME